MYSRTMAVGLVVCLLGLTVYETGCSSSLAEENPPTNISVDSNGAISGLTQSRLEAASKGKAVPIEFSLTGQTSGEVRRIPGTFSVFYENSKPKAVRLTDSDGHIIEARPKDGILQLIGKKIPINFFNERGQQWQNQDGSPFQAVVDLSKQPARSRSIDDVGKWLLIVGGAALALALPALIVAGAFGVGLVMLNAVASAIGLLIWTVFKLAMIAVVAGLVIAVFRIFIPGIDWDKIKNWAAGVWNFVTNLVDDVISQISRQVPKGASAPIDFLILLFVLWGYPDPRRLRRLSPARVPVA